MAVGLFQGLSPYWTPSATTPHWLVIVGVVLAFSLNMLLRMAGIIPLLVSRRLRLEPVQWLLLGGALAGVATYLVLTQPSSGNQYFLRAGFTFGVILSAWGFVEVLDRAGRPAPSRSGSSPAVWPTRWRCASSSSPRPGRSRPAMRSAL